MRALFFAAALLASLAAALAWPFHGGGTTADPNANQRTVDTAIYLQAIVNRHTNHQVITGQNAGESVNCFAATNDFSVQYPLVITGLYAATGQYPGLEGFGYDDFNCAGWSSLAADISPGATSLTSGAFTGALPSTPFLATITNDVANPGETVTVSAVSGSAWTISPTVYAHNTDV